MGIVGWRVVPERWRSRVVRAGRSRLPAMVLATIDRALVGLDVAADWLQRGVSRVVAAIPIGVLLEGWAWLGGRLLSVRSRLGALGGDAAEVDDGPDVVPEPSPTGQPEEPVSPVATPLTPLERARAVLSSARPDAAIELAYSAVRDALAGADHPGRRSAATHWEFLSACRNDGLDDAAIEALTTVTEAYERAAFAPTGTGSETAETALARAAELV